MKEYAIVYRKELVNSDYIVFIPDCIIEGSLDKETKTFVEKSGELYTSIYDYVSINSRNEFYHDLITEEDLLTLYETKDVNEALEKYYNDACNSIIIGKIDTKKSAIELCELQLYKTEGLSRNISYGVNSDGTSEVKLTKSQLYSLSLESSLESVRKELKKHYKRAGQIEKMSGSHGVTSIRLDALGSQLVGFATSSKTRPGVRLDEVKKRFGESIVGEDSEALSTYRYVVDRLVGQDDSVEDIISAVIHNRNATNPKELIKPFIIGPTGSGKSLLFKLLGECLGTKVLVVDCNLLVQSGYEGKNIEDVLRDLYFLCDGDIFKTEHAIVLLDEIDKLAASGASVSDIGVQQALLKFIEGNEYVIQLDRFGGEKVTIDTSMMTIAAGGAFDMLTTDNKKPMGYNCQETSPSPKKVSVEQLYEYGMISELIGRFNLFTQYNKVTEEMLYQALTNSEISPLKTNQQYYLKNYGVTLTFSDDFIKRVCSDALKRRSGFRGLDQVVNSTLSKLSFKLQCDCSPYKEAIITERTIDNPKEYQLIKK